MKLGVSDVNMKFLRNTEIQLTKEENQKKNTFFEKFQNRIEISCLPTLWVHIYLI
jgi:hypothetical protein